MSRSMSRFTAICILLLLVLFSINMVLLPIIERVAISREGLAESQYRLEKLKAMARRPDVPTGTKLPINALIKAKDHRQAESSLIGELQKLASPEMNEKITLRPLGKQKIGNILAVELNFTGSEDALATLIVNLETGVPIMRLRQWNIQVIDGPAGQVKFTANIIAAWEPK